MKNKRPIIIAAFIVLLLSIPLIAMQFPTGFDWKAADFLIAAILLFGTGALLELVLRRSKQTKYRIVLCLALFATLFLIWAELAVGIFGSPIAGS